MFDKDILLLRLFSSITLSICSCSIFFASLSIGQYKNSDEKNYVNDSVENSITSVVFNLIWLTVLTSLTYTFYFFTASILTFFGYLTIYFVQIVLILIYVLLSKNP